MTNHPPIGEQISFLRKLLGLSARQLAQRIGISDSYIFLIEHGRPPTAQQIQKIEAGLGFSLDDPRVSQLFTLLASLRDHNGDAPDV